MARELKIKRYNGSQLRASEIEQMIFLCCADGISATDVAEANGVDLQELLDWQARYRAAGVRKLRCLPSPEETVLHERIRAKDAYIAELQRLLRQKKECSNEA